MSFCVNGASFDPVQYYRDDDHARRILWSTSENPVLITGLRRIGKSWFLRRFEQIFQAGETRHFGEKGTPLTKPLESGMPRRVVLLDAGSEDFEGDLRAAIAANDRSVILAVDELEKLAADDTRRPLLDALLSYRPLILAAAPSIHEIAQLHAPNLADFFERVCVPVILGPLLEFERRALIFQTCDPGEGLSAAHENRALGKEWGGHPLVLQQVGESWKRNPKLTFPALVDLVHAVLNGAPRYGYSLCETGLTSAQRDVLLRIAAGDPPGSDDHTALQLQAHGAVVLKKGKGWAIENVVLQRYFDGLPKKAQTRREPAKPRRETQPRPSAPVRVFSWIHLSDLHFGAGDADHRFDRAAVTRAIVDDIEQNARRPIDRIFVTGDIAFSAKAGQYDDARAWLGQVAAAAAMPPGHFRFVPGNHDVDRDQTKLPLVRAAHFAARHDSKPVKLGDMLEDSAAREALAAKLAAYRVFVEGFVDHPPSSAYGLDWSEVIPAQDRVRGSLRIAGLSTVWVSDALDGNEEKPFVPNMLIARGQIEKTIGGARRDELLFVLSHHPPEWLEKGSADAFVQALARLPHVHLCGHVHQAKAGVVERFGQAGKAIRYVAGAAHGDPTEEAKHGVAWGALRFDPASGRWQAGWAPRIYVPELGGMSADRTRHPHLDADGFAWKDLECPWLAPAV